MPPGARILDYGCGIGSDGLLLLEAGYRVEFADFDNPSTAFLRWRLARRGFDAPVHDLDVEVPGRLRRRVRVRRHRARTGSAPPRGEMERRAALVVVNLLEYEPHEQTLHYELPIRAMLRYATRRGLEHYSIHYGTSHLLMYRPGRVGAVAELAHITRIATLQGRRALGRLKHEL